jgi:hypothetical protein
MRMALTLFDFVGVVKSFNGTRNQKLNAVIVGAWLARDSGAAVYQAHRVIVHRGQATLPQGKWGYNTIAATQPNPSKGRL